MSTIHESTELGPTKRQVYSPLEAYWNTFQSGANARDCEPSRIA
jgi:hypothetical protein